VLSPLVRKLAAQAGLDRAELHGTGCGGSLTRADVERARHARTPAPVPHRPRVSPYARRLARERGLDLAALTRGRPDRVLHAGDLPAAPPRPAAAAAADPRAVTAALMARSKREIPHYYLATDLDLGPALDWLRRHNREIPVARRVLPAALLVRAVALAARDVPQLNGQWRDGRFVPGEGVHLGVAVSLRGGGLAAPVLRDADTLGLDDLMARMREAAERARAGHLRSSEVAGATLTVTNLGDLGIDVIAGVIHPPQVALVGFGCVRPRPWVDGDALVVRPVVTASLSADHRATDGATGARLLHALDHHLRRPDALQ
jgi:pyruvate dehydrogenase E2 component (dihydrolipoamide acetyltransferase)